MRKIVVLHGWGHSTEMWQEFASKFNPEEVLLIDLPGFGKEPLVAPDWGVPEYANWVKTKIENLQLKEVILLGHSFGGRIASLIASENPEWLKALILYASPSIYRPSLKTQRKIKIYKLLKILGVKKKTNNLELNQADKDGLGRIFRKVVNFDQTEFLPKITVPTLIVWGSEDTETLPSIGKEISSLIPTSKIVILENLGHNAHLENLNLFYGTIKNFINNL